jgi:putative SOS response-associated peptidase YedK
VGNAEGWPVAHQRRDDKIASSNAWKPLVRSSSHRALIVADGWIEWKHAEDPKQPKQPFLHRLKDSAIFAFAGLWTVAQQGCRREDRLVRDHHHVGQPRRQLRARPHAGSARRHRGRGRVA